MRYGALEERLQVLLHDLAVRIPRQGLGKEEDLHRHLEGGELLRDEMAQLLLGRRGALLQMHDGGGLLAEGAMRKPDHRRVHDRPMLVEGVLDLDTVDVLAT